MTRSASAYRAPARSFYITSITMRLFAIRLDLALP